MTTEDRMTCCSGPNRSEECKSGEKCYCLERVPFHLRTDKVIYSKPKNPKPKIRYGSEFRPCCFGDGSEEAVPDGECRSFAGIHYKAQTSPKTPQVECRLTGDSKAEIPSVGVRLTPEGAGDWTRFDLVSDVPDSDEDNMVLGAASSLRGRQDVVADDEASDGDDLEETCRCKNPFCKSCKEVESSSESSEAPIIEKTISFDDEILEAVDSELWLYPVPRRKVIQFANIEQREKYKAELLGKMRDNAVTLPRTEWMNHIGEFDHYVTVLMGESSPESSSDCDDNEFLAEKRRIKKLRKKKRLMYGVDDIKGAPTYHTKYVRHYMEFMEDLKKRAAVTPTHYWPRFMKIFSGYGAAASEEKDPEWLGLLLMAPTECFREISSSSSCESLPVMSDPGSTTSSLSSLQCSPSACAVDSTELLKRAGVCVPEKSDNDFPTEEVAEEEGTFNAQEDEQTLRRSTKSQSQSYDLRTLDTRRFYEYLTVELSREYREWWSKILVLEKDGSTSICSALLSSPDVMKPATHVRRSTLRNPSLFLSQSQRSQNWRTLSTAALKSRLSRFSESIIQCHDPLLNQASEMLRSFSRKQSIKLLNTPEKLGLMDDIVVLQEELLPTTLGVKVREFGDGRPGETDYPPPEFEMMRRNVIFIVHGKLYKMNYECSCGETCYCDPKELVEKYVALLINEIYGQEESEDEEDEADDAKEAEVDETSRLNDDLGAASSTSRTKGVKTEDNRPSQDTGPRTPGRTRVEEPRFLLDPDVNVDLKDRAIYPRGLYNSEDIEKVKAAAPDGIIAYKDFYKHGDLKGLTKRRKEAEKNSKQEKENKNITDPSSSVLDALSDDETTESDDADVESRSLTESTASQKSSSSSHLSCQCCKCIKKYEEGGKIVRRCDKKNCSCCACKMKIDKIAKKLYTRKKGARFLYILLKKIRRAINKPNKDTREKSLQDIVNELRIEAARFTRKKWPFYFKEIMISAGLESPTESSTVSEDEGIDAHQKKNKSRKPWRYREEPKYTKKFTAADIQRQEWENLKAKSFDEEMPITSYSMPQRAVLKIEDMSRWENSEAYYEYLGFILAMNDVIKGHSCKEKFPHSPNVEALVTILNHLSDWIDEIPPIQQPQRFGNKSFRTWLDRVSKEGPTVLVDLMPAKFHGGLGEAQAYLLEGFGNCTRIDYGTGHEMAFIMFLCCLFKIGVFIKDDHLPVVLTIFPKYLDVVRKLQTVYKMEPAGSRGVWALDDFQFIPFLWGSAQLIGHPHIRPTTFLKNEVVTGFYDHFMFLACIKYINENKIGPFAEHSNQLWNISAVPTWDKVNSGLIKMYKGEVLCKFPVIQHVLFGSILPITPAPPSQSERVYTGLVRDGLQPINKPKPCMQPPPPPPPQAQPTPPVERTGSLTSSIGDDGLAEKFQNVPDPEKPDNPHSSSPNL